MIVLVLSAADATAIRDALPEGELKAAIAREVAAAGPPCGLPDPGVPELVIARPRWEYVECIPDDATAERCWRAMVRAFRARPSAPRVSGRRRATATRVRVGAATCVGRRRSE